MLHLEPSQYPTGARSCPIATMFNGAKEIVRGLRAHGTLQVPTQRGHCSFPILATFNVYQAPVFRAYLPRRLLAWGAAQGGEISCDFESESQRAARQTLLARSALWVWG